MHNFIFAYILWNIALFIINYLSMHIFKSICTHNFESETLTSPSPPPHNSISSLITCGQQFPPPAACHSYEIPAISKTTMINNPINYPQTKTIPVQHFFSFEKDMNLTIRKRRWFRFHAEFNNSRAELNFGLLVFAF